MPPESKPNDKNSLANTFKVAVLLSLVCSVGVSVFAVGLRDMQEANQKAFRKQNILQAAAGLLGVEDVKGLPAGEKDALYDEQVLAVFVELETGEVSLTIPDPKTNEPIEPEDFDEKTASKNEKTSVKVEDNVAGLQGGRREKHAVAYFVYENDEAKAEAEKAIEKNETPAVEPTGYVLPIRGYGLWGTLWGFLALDADGTTIRGITYYDHKETPGLGAEVENVDWRASWDGKQAYDQDGDVVIEVVKGQAAGESEIDGLAGATITSRGVTNMMEYWLGPQGFGPFLAKTTPEGGGADG